MVIPSPLGTPGTYFATGSPRRSLPSWASSKINAAVIVLVFEAIRKWVSARGGVVAPSVVVPEVTVNSPWGVRRTTTAPGTRSSLTAVSTVACSVAWSIGLSAGEPAVDAGGAVAPAAVDAVEVDEVGLDDHPAIRRPAPTTKLAIRRYPSRRRDGDCPRDVRMSFLRSYLGLEFPGERRSRRPGPRSTLPSSHTGANLVPVSKENRRDRSDRRAGCPTRRPDAPFVLSLGPSPSPHGRPSPSS